MSAIEAEWAPLHLSKPGPLPPNIPEPGDPPAKPPPTAGGPAAVTQPVGSDVQIKKMLTDERMRCEILLKNYKDLHAEYTSLLQGELAQRQGELKQLTLDQQSHQESLELLLRLRGELLAKTRELEEMRLQVMTPQRLELLRAQLRQDMMEGPVREHFNRLEEKIEKHRSEYKELLYEHILLTCENISLKSRCYDDDDDPEESEGEEPEETTVRLEAEAARPERREEGPVIQNECASDPSSREEKRAEAPPKDSRRASRLQGLEAEVSELRAQNARLADQLHEAEGEVGSLTCQVDGMKKHALRSEAACGVESKADVERECDELQTQPRGLRYDAEVLEESATRREQQEVLTEKDMELIRRVPATREQEAYKTWLENRLADTEQEIDELERRNRTLGVQLGTLSRSQSDVVETNERLRDMLDSVCEELRATRAEADRSQHEAAAGKPVLVDEEKHRLQQRHTEMQDKYSKAKEKLQRNNRKILELGLEADAAEKCPSLSEEHLIRQLRELRHAM